MNIAHLLLYWFVSNAVLAVPSAWFTLRLRRQRNAARHDVASLLRVLSAAWSDPNTSGPMARRLHGHLVGLAPHLHNLFHEADTYLAGPRARTDAEVGIHEIPTTPLKVLS